MFIVESTATTKTWIITLFITVFSYVNIYHLLVQIEFFVTQFLNTTKNKLELSSARLSNF